MWHGVWEYLLLVTGLAIGMHAISGRYLRCLVGGATLASALNLIHEAWKVDWQVNVAWTSPLFVIGSLIAMPVFAVVGLPFQWWRHHRSPKTQSYVSGA